MKKSFSITTILSLAVLLTFSSCDKDNDGVEVPLAAQESKNLFAEPTATGNHYAFFSLERNEVVPFTDSASAKWDIAFRSTTIITNSGTGGPGAGGAFIQKATAFDTYSSIPADSTFRVDGATALAVPTGSGNGWYNYNGATNVISPIPGNVIVVRTASGKYAKLEILSYYKDAPATPTSADVARYFTFRFIYQPNGTKSF